MKYYFTRKPKRLIKIYDHAIGQLTEIETLLSGEPDEIPSQQGDLWKGAAIYFLSDKPENDKIYFDHDILYSGGLHTAVFSNRLSLLISHSIRALQPGLVLPTVPTPGNGIIFPAIKYIKDGHHIHIHVFSNHRDKFTGHSEGMAF